MVNQSSLFCPLASGSKGNSSYLATKTTKILIDAGLSCKDLEERLQEIGSSLAEIDAILITHGHHDHISALRVITKRYDIPILANALTAREIYPTLDTRARFMIFTTGETFQFRDLTIDPFSIQHDTLDPVAFTITVEGIKIGLCTDIGTKSPLVAAKLRGCNYLLLEANHDPDMVRRSKRPPYYKERVLSNLGHLSNQEALALLNEIYDHRLERLYLGHLSEECNHPELALNTFKEKFQNYLDVRICHQKRVSDPIFFGIPSLQNTAC